MAVISKTAVCLTKKNQTVGNKATNKRNIANVLETIIFKNSKINNHAKKDCTLVFYGYTCY